MTDLPQPNKMLYRLALNLGPDWLGWTILRLKHIVSPSTGKYIFEPYAVVKAGVRIFSDGRDPKDGTSLAVIRRMARATRRRRQRLLKRKARMMSLLVKTGFFPEDPLTCKQYESLNPYELRAKGLDQVLTPTEFARALFHINQRRGFKSNRKTDYAGNDSSLMKSAIASLRAELIEKKCRTVGELLYQRQQQGLSLRARYREKRILKDDGKTKIEKNYDLYVDRSMIETEFDSLWAKQTEFNPELFTEEARTALKDCLLFQRPLKPIDSGRCTLMPEERCALMALPSSQRFRIYHEVNSLRILKEDLSQSVLTLEQRDILVAELEKSKSVSFKKIIRLLKLSPNTQFNLENPSRNHLKGNATSVILADESHFGDAWYQFDEKTQDEIVEHIIDEQSELDLLTWLQKHTQVDSLHAENIINAKLPEGYGRLSTKALARILPELQKTIISYDKAVPKAGFEYHCAIIEIINAGFILPELPYYGQYLQHRMGFGTGNPEDPPEKRFGRIANPTVHIGFNQIRSVVNGILKRYGHPTEIRVEVARELKQSREQRLEFQKTRTVNLKRNESYREQIAALLGIDEKQVRYSDIQKMVLWEELNPTDAQGRCCPYSGQLITPEVLFSDEVVIDHILPFSRTLDNSLINKTVAFAEVCNLKANHTPWEVKAEFENKGWEYKNILQRAMLLPQNKRYRFGEEGYCIWLRDKKTFILRALEDMRYLPRIVVEYLGLICPRGTRAIPGQMTSLLRHKLGLNNILGPNDEKRKNDFRHFALDACVTGITDKNFLQRFADASAQTRQKNLNPLVDSMPLPWENYYEHVKRAIENIKVSHRQDHGYEGEIFDASIYGILGNGLVTYRQTGNGPPQRKPLNREVVEFTDPRPKKVDGQYRHGTDENNLPKPYKGLWNRSNFCIEIEREENNDWIAQVIPRYKAYHVVKEKGRQALYNPNRSLQEKPLVMRLMINDTVIVETDNKKLLLRVMKISNSGSVTFTLHNEANICARYTAKLEAQKMQKAGHEYNESALTDDFFQKSISPSSLQALKARQVYISPTGEISDPGFKT